MADVSESKIPVNVYYGDFSNRTLPFTREELQWIRDRAQSMASIFSDDGAWAHAYMELSSDANYLDMMLARAHVTATTPMTFITTHPTGTWLNGKKIEGDVEHVNQITDGYSFWDDTCPMCGKRTMQVVRIGKVQCSECG